MKLRPWLWKSRSDSGKVAVALGSVVIAALVGLVSYEIWRQREETLDSARATLTSLSLALAEQTASRLHSIDLVVQATVASIEAAGGPGAMPHDELGRMLRDRVIGLPMLIGLAVVDEEGRAFAFGRAAPPRVLDASNRDYFVFHRDPASPSALHFGTPTVSPLDGRKLIPLSRRLRHQDGRFAGVVIAAADPKHIGDGHATVLPRDGGTFTLFHNDGTLLSRSPYDPELPGRRYEELSSLLFRDALPAVTVSAYSPIDRQPRIIAFHRIANYPLAVAVSVNENLLLAPWRGNATRLTGAGLLAIALVGAVAAVLVRQLEGQARQAAKLKTSEERLRIAQFALDNASDMVFMIDRDGIIRYANEAASARLGFGAATMAGMPFSAVDPGFGPEDWRRHLAELREKRRMPSRAEYRCGDGSTFPAEIAFSLVEFEGAEYSCAFVHDIGERVAAEAALAEKNASLEASNAELEQFAYVASHDLREPLRMIGSFVSMLERRYADRLDQDGREFIAFAQDGARRMDRLILDLLEYSRVGRFERPFETVALSPSIVRATHTLSVAAREHGATITFDPDMPSVHANDEELQRLLVNLLGNALKYRHPDRRPEIAVTARRLGGEVEIGVADNGIGIAPQYFERIFRIFQRLHARDAYDGTGIGLAICRKIVERHGGRIWVESEPGMGSTFKFTLKAA